MKPLQNLPHFHEPILPLECEFVNPQNDRAQVRPANRVEFGTAPQSGRRLHYAC